MGLLPSDRSALSKRFLECRVEKKTKMSAAILEHADTKFIDMAAAEPLAAPSTLLECAQKLSLGESPKILECMDWNMVRNHFMPLIREEIGSVDLQPPQED
jgi:hypothetical protein